MKRVCPVARQKRPAKSRRLALTSRRKFFLTLMLIVVKNDGLELPSVFPFDELPVAMST